jgi:hypothetical protein
VVFVFFDATNDIYALQKTFKIYVAHPLCLKDLYRLIRGGDISLQGLVHQLFGVYLSKEETLSLGAFNDGHPPSREQIEYAANDTVFLVGAAYLLLRPFLEYEGEDVQLNHNGMRNIEVVMRKGRDLRYTKPVRFEHEMPKPNPRWTHEQNIYWNEFGSTRHIRLQYFRHRLAVKCDVHDRILIPDALLLHWAMAPVGVPLRMPNWASEISRRFLFARDFTDAYQILNERPEFDFRGEYFQSMMFQRDDAIQDVINCVLADELLEVGAVGFDVGVEQLEPGEEALLVKHGRNGRISSPCCR